MNRVRFLFWTETAGTAFGKNYLDPKYIANILKSTSAKDFDIAVPNFKQRSIEDNSVKF